MTDTPVREVLPAEPPATPAPPPTTPKVVDAPENEQAVRLGRVYDAVSKNIERENALINFRIMWAIVLSAGILAAEGVIINYVQDAYGNSWEFHKRAQQAVVFLTCTAIFFCFVSFCGVLAAVAQMRHVKKRYIHLANSFDKFHFPRPFGSRIANSLGNATAMIFPFALMALWGVFLYFQNDRLIFIYHHRAEFEVQLSAKENRLISPLKAISDQVEALTKQIEALPAKLPAPAPPPSPSRAEARAVLNTADLNDDR